MNGTLHGKGPGGLSAEFEKILAESTAKESDVTPGAVLIAVDKNGDIYRKASGWQSRLPDAPPLKEDNIMWIASCTKLITSVCALQCVERGLVTLDEPISRILPELTTREVITFDEGEGGGYSLKPATTPITLRLLLTHTSGVPYEWAAGALGRWRKDQPPIPKEREGRIATVYDLPLFFEPGEGWTYGGGIDWAGVMVGRLYGMTLAEYMDREVFKPMGMESTTFHIDQRPDLKERLMLAGKREDDGRLTPFEGWVFPEHVVDDSGGGGLWSCATDYVKVLADLIKDEPILLKRETVVNMLSKPQIEKDSALGMLVGARSIAGANAAPADAGMNYGLGGMVLTKTSDTLPAGTLSWGGLPNLKWFLHPELRVAAMYATQVMPHGDQKNTWLSGEFFKEVIRVATADK